MGHEDGGPLEFQDMLVALRHAQTFRAVTNLPFQVLILNWHSPESDGWWFKSSQLENKICPPSGLRRVELGTHLEF